MVTDDVVENDHIYKATEQDLKALEKLKSREPDPNNLTHTWYAARFTKVKVSYTRACNLFRAGERVSPNTQMKK